MCKYNCNNNQTADRNKSVAEDFSENIIRSGSAIMEKVSKFFKSITPLRFMEIPQVVIEKLDNQGQIETAFATIEFQNQQNAIGVKSTIVFKKDEQPYKLDNAIDTIVLKQFMPRFTLDGIEDGTIGSITLTEDDFECMYNERDIKTVAKGNWDDILKEGENLRTTEIELCDRIFYTLVSYKSNNQVKSMVKYGVIANIPTNLFSQLYPSQKATINI